jgi:hypothetical protein
VNNAVKTWIVAAVIAGVVGWASYWVPELYHDWKFLHAARVQSDLVQSVQGAIQAQPKGAK